MKKTTWMQLTATTAMALSLAILSGGCQKQKREQPPATGVGEQHAVEAPAVTPAVEPAVKPAVEPAVDPAAQKPMDHPAH